MGRRSADNTPTNPPPNTTGSGSDGGKARGSMGDVANEHSGTTQASTITKKSVSAHQTASISVTTTTSRVTTTVTGNDVLPSPNGLHSAPSNGQSSSLAPVKISGKKKKRGSSPSPASATYPPQVLPLLQQASNTPSSSSSMTSTATAVKLAATSSALSKFPQTPTKKKGGGSGGDEEARKRRSSLTDSLLTSCSSSSASVGSAEGSTADSSSINSPQSHSPENGTDTSSSGGATPTNEEVEECGRVGETARSPQHTRNSPNTAIRQLDMGVREVNGGIVNGEGKGEDEEERRKKAEKAKKKREKRRLKEKERVAEQRKAREENEEDDGRETVRLGSASWNKPPSTVYSTASQMLSCTNTVSSVAAPTSSSCHQRHHQSSHHTAPSSTIGTESEPRLTGFRSLHHQHPHHHPNRHMGASRPLQLYHHQLYSYGGQLYSTMTPSSSSPSLGSGSASSGLGNTHYRIVQPVTEPIYFFPTSLAEPLLRPTDCDCNEEGAEGGKGKPVMMGDEDRELVDSSAVEYGVDGKLTGVPNGVEVEAVMKIFDEQAHHLKSHTATASNSWILSLYSTMVDGDYSAFLHALRLIMVTLHRSGSTRYRQMGMEELRRHVIQAVVSHFHNRREGTTVLMTLVAARDVRVGCAETGHGYCRIAQTLLNGMSAKERCKLMAVRTSRCGKTALHLAATIGQPCQLLSLLYHQPDPNPVDRSGRTPLHYAIERCSLEMVRLLAWYGSDMSLAPVGSYSHPPRQLALANVMNAAGGGRLASYVDARLDAMESKVKGWIEALVGKQLHPFEPCSPVHTWRLCVAGAGAGMDVTRKTRTFTFNLLRSGTPQFFLHNRFKFPNSRALLFMLPYVYLQSDATASPDSPQLRPSRFPRGVRVEGMRITHQSCAIGPYSPVTVFPPLYDKRAVSMERVVECEGGRILGFELPFEVLDEGAREVTFTLTAERGSFEGAEQVLVAVKAMFCADRVRQEAGYGHQQRDGSGEVGPRGKCKKE